MNNQPIKQCNQLINRNLAKQLPKLGKFQIESEKGAYQSRHEINLSLTKLIGVSEGTNFNTSRSGFCRALTNEKLSFRHCPNLNEVSRLAQL